MGAVTREIAKAIWRLSIAAVAGYVIVEWIWFRLAEWVAAVAPSNAPPHVRDLMQRDILWLGGIGAATGITVWIMAWIVSSLRRLIRSS